MVMPWCHRCKTEYRKGFAVCSDCGGELSDEPPPPEKPPVYAREAYLTTARNEAEADMLRAKLEAESIPVLLKFRENGDFLHLYTGLSRFGVDIYVPEPALKKARIIAGLCNGTDEP